MDLYPALDVTGGRLARAGPPGTDPLRVLAEWVAAGARRVHFVDLDRVFGRGENPDVTRAVLAVREVLVQVGGGLTDAAEIGDLLAQGAHRVVIGAGLAVDSARLEALVARHGAERIAVGLDVRNGRVAPRAAPPLDLEAIDLARAVRACGVRTVVWTDTARDGTLQGADLDGARAAAALGVHVLVGGGIGSLEELAVLRRAGLDGAILGRALHEGRFSLREALACVRS